VGPQRFSLPNNLVGGVPYLVGSHLVSMDHMVAEPRVHGTLCPVSAHGGVPSVLDSISYFYLKRRVQGLMSPC
jgi:hypothetical protein